MQKSFKGLSGTSLAVQWLRLCASTAGGTGSIPGWRTKILHATKGGQKIKKKKKDWQIVKNRFRAGVRGGQHVAGKWGDLLLPPDATVYVEMIPPTQGT